MIKSTMLTEKKNFSELEESEQRILNLKMKVRELQKKLVAEDRASYKLPDQSVEKSLSYIEDTDFLPSVLNSTNITIRRNDTRTVWGYPPKAASGIQIELTKKSTRQISHREVTFKKLPFYRVLGKLVKPSYLLPDNSSSGNAKNTFKFYLTPQQVKSITTSQINQTGSDKIDYVVQVQMRFCLNEKTHDQADCIPPGVTAKVNGRYCYIPFQSTLVLGAEKSKKYPEKPIDITSLVKLTSYDRNHVQITCPSDFEKKYVVGIFLVRKLTSYELTNQLRIYNMQNADYTRVWIQEKLDEDADNEIATTSLKVSLVCPLGKMRMTTPCRASTCTHLQCFDARLYLQMNELRPTWCCPVCNNPATHDSLVIDGYFKEILASDKLVEDQNEIHLLPDGSWEILTTSDQDKKTKKKESGSKIKGGKIEVEKTKKRIAVISDDEEDLVLKNRKLNYENQIIVQTLD